LEVFTVPAQGRLFLSVVHLFVKFVYFSSRAYYRGLLEDCMKRLTATFAACALTAILASCTPPEKPENFNPVREQLQTHGLMQLAQAEPQGKAVCEFDRGLVASALQSGDRDWFTHRNGKGLMLTFYMCNAVDAPGFEDNPYNDAVIHPPAGQTAGQAKDTIRAELAAQEAKLCSGLTGDPTQDDKFIAKFCEALKPAA
jgi:hypothetical protein